jgi:hypothetical protein
MAFDILLPCPFDDIITSIIQSSSGTHPETIRGSLPVTMRYHIDTHVHVYHCYEPEDFLAQAISNSAMTDPAATLILCLTESSGFNFFDELKTRADAQSPIAGWSVSELPEHPAILLSKSDQRIIFIAGKQVITQQGLEVLALFNDENYEDGQDTQSIINKINENHGLAVLPWGVGKWLGKRGSIITELLNSNSPGNLAIADISARPALWPHPPQFRQAHESGYKLLYGTDPLPLAYDQGRIASAGMTMELSDDASQAITELKPALIKQTENNHYGNRVSAFRFVKDQLMLRINKKTCLSAP